MAKTCSHEGCEYPVFSKGLCNMHWRSKYATRIPAYRAAGANNSIPKIRRRTPVKKISDKHSKELKVYSQLRQDFLSKHTECQIKKPGCWIVATQVHHEQGRGILLNDTSKWKAVCSGPCHDEITENSAQAIEDGHSRRRNTPVERQIFHRKDGT